MKFTAGIMRCKFIKNTIEKICLLCIVRSKSLKKILFCIDSLKPGGAEIIMCNTVNELVKDPNLNINSSVAPKRE